MTMVEEEQHLTLPCSVQVSQTPYSFVDGEALVDSGATACFVDQSFLQKHGLSKTPLPKARALELADPSSKSTITHFAEIPLVIGLHTEKVYCYVVPKLVYPLILGLPWLSKHDIRPNTRGRCVTFHPSSCPKECLPMREPCSVFSNKTVKPAKAVDIDGISCSTVGIGEFCELIQEDGAEAIAFLPTNHHETSEDTEPHALGLSSARLAAANPADYDKFMNADNSTDWSKLPPWLQDFKDVFSRAEAEKLPPHRPGQDHEIKIETNGKPLPHKKTYGMSRDELAASKKYVDDELAKQAIRPSNSPVASPVIVVKKPGGGLRFCVDYRAINAITIKNRYPIPRIRETLDRLCKAKFYTKLDIIAAFNRIRVKEGCEWLTAFTTRYGQFEYLVMPFGLCNAPSTFQNYINTALQDVLDVFCTAYLDDILIFSETLKDHRRHVREVLKRLRKAALHVDLKKCEFEAQEVKYLGLIVTTQGVRMDPAKIETIQNWPTPRTHKDVLAFLEFVNFYRKFILHFGRVALPLTDMAKTKDKVLSDKEKPVFIWSSACQRAFEELKRRAASDPIMQHFDPDKDSHVEVDASDYVTAGILSQTDSNGALRPVAYFSKKMSPAECNYEIYDKELLAIVRAFEEWRPELAGNDPKHPVNVLSDHRSLEYFMTTKELNRRQARWSEFLSEFQFKIQYRPGKQGTKPDSLTRRPGDIPESEQDARVQHQHQVVLKPANLGEGILPAKRLQTCAMLASTLEEESSTSDKVLHAYAKDELVTALIQALADDARTAPTKHQPRLRALGVSLADLSMVDGRLYFQGRLWIPDDDGLILSIIKSHHDAPAAGHPGRHKTYELLKRNYYWPQMQESVRRFTNSCHGCKRSKAFRKAYDGSLHQLSVPNDPWQHIAVDFVVDLPPSKYEGEDTEYRNIMVVTDRLTKMRQYVPCTDMDAISTAKMFYRHVFSLFGLPETVTSDRGSQFISVFLKRLYERLDIKRQLSTAFHPQTDGQSENSNQIMEQYLRCYTDWLQTDWVEWLPAAQFAANNHVSETTQVTPFYANYGRHPRSGVEPPPALPPSSAKAKLDAQSADAFANRMEELHLYLREQMTWAQATYERSVAKRRTPAPMYQPGDEVWLDTRNLKTERPAKKLDSKHIGPLKVLERIHANAYRLELPSEMRVHNVFHTCLLTPVATDPLPGQRDHEKPPPVVVVRNDDEAEEEWEVERVLDSKHFGKKKRLLYKLQWKGYSPD